MASPNLTSLTNEQLLTCLKEVEAAAEDVLTDKQEVVDLDRKRHANREALGALDKLTRASYKGEEAKAWMAVSNCFFKIPAKEAKDMIRQDQIKLDTEINVLRSNLKLKVNRLREKEGRDELRDLGLKALSKDEVAAVRSVIGPAPSWR